MNEWQVFLVIVALLGFLGVVVPPIVKLTTSITKLNDSVQNLNTSIEKQDAENKESHKKLWEHNDKQDVTINQHENRINLLEQIKER